jgi:hypothetical protein
MYATSLTSLTIGNGVTSIGYAAFYNATSLTSLTIGNSVTAIWDYAFGNATSLTSLVIPESVTSIGYAAFHDATSLTSLTIPNNVTSIDADAFYNAAALASYQYCGTSLTLLDLAAAGLGSKTIIGCVSAPTAPTSVVATATGKRSATVSFGSPASNGGSVVTSYTATSTPGGLTQMLVQATGGTFSFTGLLPNTAYTFAVTATNAIGISAAATSNLATTAPLVVASLLALSFTDNGTGTGGKIAWSGNSIDAVLYTGPANSYPGPYSYGAFTGSWNGLIRNLTPDTSYTVSIFAVSADGVGEAKTLTFKTSAAFPELPGAASATSPVTDVAKLAKMISWINENTFIPGEAANISSLLSKFMALETSIHRSYIKVPTSRVSAVVATSLTPKACSVVSATAKVDAGLVTALSQDTCSISYTVSGGSKAPVTMVRDFVFKKVSVKL